MRDDPLAGFPLEQRIGGRAAACGLTLGPKACSQLAAHARAVLRANDELRLTSIVEPEAFVERHLGEAFEGAALLPTDVEGLLVDLGSGNGYPGLPLALSRPGLRLLMAEASVRKAAFLTEVVCSLGLEGVDVFGGQIQRAADLPGEEPVRVLASRAMGAWPKIVPRLMARLGPQADVLLWCGVELESIARRTAWRRLTVVGRRELPGRDRSFIWDLRPASG